MPRSRRKSRSRTFGRILEVGDFASNVVEALPLLRLLGKGLLLPFRIIAHLVP